MDAIDILGNLLGKKTGGSGMGTKILKDILGGGGKSAPPSKPAPVPRQTPSYDRNPDSETPFQGSPDISRQARELEDLLNVATQRQQNRAPNHGTPGKMGTQGTRGQTNQPNSSTPNQSGRAPDADIGGYKPNSNTPKSLPAQPTNRRPLNFPSGNSTPENLDAQAMILVRAMINAAKADGQVSQAEQQAILSQIGDASPETIRFLQNEFNTPLDVREFAWSVPLGLEQQVYTMSLISVNLDSNPEAEYLYDLAHGLRIPPEVCNDIHRRYGAPLLYK